MPIEAAPDATLVVDAAGRIVLVNAQAERLFGYARSELLGGGVELLVPERFRAAHASDRSGYVGAPRVRPMGAKGQTFAARRKDGTEFPAEISLSPFDNEQGRFTIACIRDVSERRKAEEALRANAELHRIQEAREDVLRAVAHDLRAPLAVIHLHAQRLAQRGNDPDVQRELEAIVASSSRMATMIGKLVESARPDDVELEKRPVDLHALIADLLARTAGVLDASRIEVDVRELPPVEADPSALERILMNLVSNALKYAPAPTPVRVTAGAVGDEVIVAVIDQGPGIPPDDVPHLFDRFWRARRTRRTEGLGLGLFITRRLVTAHSGRIWVESEPGRGTTFYFTLPVA